MNKTAFLYALLTAISITILPSSSQSQTVSGRSFQGFNPDLSVVGDMLGKYSSREDGGRDDGFQLREVEIGITSPVDPYGRFTTYMGISKANAEWGLDLEEAFFRLTTLPYGFQVRVGQFRAYMGKTNTQHGHVLPWVDYPLVNRVFLGDEGMKSTGMEVSRLLPNPWDYYIELTYELSNNDQELFGGTTGKGFIHLVHLKNFIDLSASSTLEIGLSGAARSDGMSGSRNDTEVGGVDMTYKWRPLLQGLYRDFEWRTEFLASRRRANDDALINSWGMFTSVKGKISQRWSVSVRYDFSEQPDNSEQHEHDYSSYLTFHQSEFAYWRLGYEFDDPNFGQAKGKGDNRIFLQANVSIGAHPAHAY